MFDKNEYIRKHYQDNKQYYKDKAKLKREFNLKWLREYKSDKKCIQCGFSHPAALDFHHRNPEDKDGQVCVMASQGCSIERIQKEIDKCDILCANCHRILHYREQARDA